MVIVRLLSSSEDFTGRVALRLERWCVERHWSGADWVVDWPVWRGRWKNQGWTPEFVLVSWVNDSFLGWGMHKKEFSFEHVFWEFELQSRNMRAVGRGWNSSVNVQWKDAKEYREKLAESQENMKVWILWTETSPCITLRPVFPWPLIHNSFVCLLFSVCLFS